MRLIAALSLCLALSGCLPPPSGSRGPIEMDPDEFAKGWTGQTREQLLESYGKPYEVETPIFGNGTTETWRYRRLLQHPNSATAYDSTRFVIVKKTGRIGEVYSH